VTLSLGLRYVSEFSGSLAEALGRPHTARQLQHDVPHGAVDASSTRTWTGDLRGLQQTSSAGAGSKVSLEV
jgi:hypothetical protein